MPFKTNLKIVLPPLPPLPSRANEDEPPKPETPKGPVCRHCMTVMTWYESKLENKNGHRKIVHSFHCDNCGATSKTETRMKAQLRVV